MINIEVKVTGPGGVINFETLIIKRALEQVGITVEVEDEYPFSYRVNQNVIQETEDEYIERITKLNETCSTTVKLIAEHCPWGG